MKLKINFQNCYGINKFVYNFNFDKNNYLIYAPNGTMKTSFFRTFDDYLNDKKARDVFYEDRITVQEILDENDKNFSKESIVLIKSQYDKDYSESMSYLLVNSTLKKRYDSIFKSIDKIKKDLEKELKKYDVKIIDILEFYKVGEFYNLTDELIDADYINFGDIKFSDIFNDDSKNILSQEVIINSLNDYIDVCDHIIQEKDYFVKNLFDFYNLKNVFKSLESEHFFDAKHLLKLFNNSTGEYNDINQNDMTMIINDIDKELSSHPSVAACFNSLTKKISSRKLNNIIVNNIWLIPLLNDYEGLKASYFKFVISSSEIIKSLYLQYSKAHSDNFDELKQILKESSSVENIKLWQDAVDEFNSKFINMPFKLRIANLSDVILKNDSCQLIYSYNDKDDVPLSDLKEFLSDGEKSAFYILNFLFELKVRESRCIESVIIFDDLADSFDYKNKYAIVEMVKDLSDNPNFHWIILTHNFDFHRICKNQLRPYTYIAIKREEIVLKDFYYSKNVFNTFKDKLNEEKYFLSSIPFVRNICDMISDEPSFLLLTSCLHIKNDTRSLRVNDINQIFFNIINKPSSLSDELYLDLLFRTADNLIVNHDDVLLEDKLVFAIAIRLKLEQHLIDLINDPNVVGSISDNQTGNLIRICKQRGFLSDSLSKLCDKVLILVSDNIHVNAFMYEPLIDTTIDDLIVLYNEIKLIS